MAGGSIALGVFAFIAMVGGMLGVFLPYYLGTVFSSLSLILSLAGIVVGGLAISRAKRDGESTTLPIAGLVTNIVAFIFGLLVFLTCGLCSACLNANGGMNSMRRVPLDGGGFYYTNTPPGEERPPFGEPEFPPRREQREPPMVEPLPGDPAAPPSVDPGATPPSDPAAPTPGK